MMNLKGSDGIKWLRPCMDDVGCCRPSTEKLTKLTAAMLLNKTTMRVSVTTMLLLLPLLPLAAAACAV